MYGEGAQGDLTLYNGEVTALLRSITCVTAIALLLFVGLHALIPHQHSNDGSVHVSDVAPTAHMDNKIFLMLLVALLVPLFFDTRLRSIAVSLSVVGYMGLERQVVQGAIPIRYQEALRKGRIHSRAD